MKKTINDSVKKAAPIIAVAVPVLLTACDSSVNWADAEQGAHDLVVAAISFVSAALGVVFTWVLGNLKGWLEEAKKKKTLANVSRETNNNTKEDKNNAKN